MPAIAASPSSLPRPRPNPWRRPTRQSRRCAPYSSAANRSRSKPCSARRGSPNAFLYTHPDLRKPIEYLRAKARSIPAAPAPSDAESTLVLALTGQIAHLKKQHRHEAQALRAALERAHGENLDLRRELDRRGWAGAPRPAVAD